MKKSKATLTKIIATRTVEEWTIDNKESFLNYHKQYRMDNQVKIIAIQKNIALTIEKNCTSSLGQQGTIKHTSKRTNTM
jgi:hypothetical protein